MATATADMKQYQADYYAANKEKIKGKQRDYRAANERRRTVRGIFSNARGMAKRRNHLWDLTLDEFIILREGLCTYCQFPLPEVGSGLDRIDNSKDYEAGNVVPCCTACNRTRGDHYTHQEMLELGPLLRDLKLRRRKVVSEFAGRLCNMATIAELQKKMLMQGFKAAVYQHLIDHLEGEFRSHAGMAAKKVLLNDVKQPVPDDVFADVVGELFAGLSNVTTEINNISNTDVQPAAPVAVAPVPAPVPVVAPVPAKKSKKSKSTTQGEVPS